ncbi:hypothetical protein [Streptomyces cucumeris]|uniref:hypothetical protein n=1 Tax=Streptomyces cucumeris TaxID=2962890 RepID=UPI0020C910EB|nr:hypothetical protein [Streptomyces sp. NEAU-Y11]MCP9209557.1 hypothetical protein [Streptomyces sp. NEAU-Y11]
MSDAVTSERVVGKHNVDGRDVYIMRLTWRDSFGLSFDVYDAKTDECFTEESSFDEYPTDEQIRSVLHPCDLRVECKFCRNSVPAQTAHRHDGNWVGDECCWDDRLRMTE